jgi:hypothetical protein
MLVKDVMSSPVVTVAPGAHPKEVAALRALLEEELGPPSP